MLSMSIVGATVGMSYGQDKVVRIGFQKYGKLVLLKGKGSLEQKLKPLGYRVAWKEFPEDRSFSKRSTSVRSTSARPAKRRRSSLRPPERPFSTSATSRRPKG